MKKTVFFIVPALLIFAGCKKDKNDDNQNPPNDTVYMNTAAGSTWKYKTVDNSEGTADIDTYTITSTGRDTMINSKKYSVYSDSFGENSYLSRSGENYYSFDSEDDLDFTGGIERLYLRTDVKKGDSWVQDVTLNVEGLTIPVKLINTVADKNMNRVVEGKNYEKVIRVITKIEVQQLPIDLNTNIEAYYAPQVGLIEGVNDISFDFMGEGVTIKVTTTLQEAHLK